MPPDNKALEEKRRWLEQVARNAVAGLGKMKRKSLSPLLRGYLRLSRRAPKYTG